MSRRSSVTRLKSWQTPSRFFLWPAFPFDLVKINQIGIFPFLATLSRKYIGGCVAIAFEAAEGYRRDICQVIRIRQASLKVTSTFGNEPVAKIFETVVRDTPTNNSSGVDQVPVRQLCQVLGLEPGEGLNLCAG